MRDRENVYALGDAAALLDPKKNQPVPALAQAAIEEARVVAENIALAISGGKKIVYSFPYLHSLVPLGAKYALADVNGHLFRGFPAWIVRQIADLRYLLRIISPLDALRVWWRGARVYTRND